MDRNPLLDQAFLKELDLSPNRETFVKIIALNKDEQPLEEIQGRATSGTINLDGKSAVRRTCSLTLVAQDINLHDYYWTFKTKFKLLIGLRNNINSNYDDIIWFPMGVYVITSFNSSVSTNNYTINISGKDKMCLLNGELNGAFTGSVDFGVEQIVNEDNSVIYNKIPIKTIIKEAVHQYGAERWSNIIINDLDDYGIKLMEYRGDIPLYMIKQIDTDEVDNMTLDADFTVYVNSVATKISTLPVYQETSGIASNEPTEFTLTVDATQKYVAIKIEAGETAGYEPTILVYPDELIAKVGESVTSVLDKIVKMLTNFEYFYDLDGRFVFQRKRSYIVSSFEGINYSKPDEYYIENRPTYIYSFEGNNQLTAIRNQPDMVNLKNDFSIWGVRDSAEGSEIPIHFRYAIDKKPHQYTNYENTKTFVVADTVDWREIIYQMAADYAKYNHADDFESKIRENNGELYPTGKTGYEQYYTDLLGFWRDIYSEDGKWNENVTANPQLLNFWFDFLDTQGQLGQYAVFAVGNRTKAVDENTVKAIAYKETPGVIFYSAETLDIVNEFRQQGYTYINLTDSIKNLFTISDQGKSAKNRLEELLYNHFCCTEQINLTSIPIYYLEPNTVIYVHDDHTKIDGKYELQKMTIPLSYNGTMSMTATKLVDQLY